MDCCDERNAGIGGQEGPSRHLSGGVHPIGGQGVAEANIGSTELEQRTGIFSAVPPKEEVTS